MTAGRLALVLAAALVRCGRLLALPAPENLYSHSNKVHIVMTEEPEQITESSIHYKIETDSLFGMVKKRILKFAQEPNNSEIIKNLVLRNEGFCDSVSKLFRNFFKAIAKRIWPIIKILLKFLLQSLSIGEKLETETVEDSAKTSELARTDENLNTPRKESTIKPSITVSDVRTAEVTADGSK
ncbi:uncharacterized protein LOC134546156 [Bacillus rossius redtenbacheri]|uniref:uncharacterized protein LOC134546156 n=1 Tax=Bacillus rossius redtenbacheri TaxID=93214 RepID=UPI002FDCD806